MAFDNIGKGVYMYTKIYTLNYVFLIQIYGNGNQTRSFQYVSDLVKGLIALMNSNTTLPVNIGNPEEYTIKKFAEIIRDLVGNDFFSKSVIRFR